MTNVLRWLQVVAIVVALLTAIGLGAGIGVGVWSRWFADKCYLNVYSEVSFDNADPSKPVFGTRIEVVRLPAGAPFPLATQVGCPP